TVTGLALRLWTGRLVPTSLERTSFELIWLKRIWLKTNRAKPRGSTSLGMALIWVLLAGAVAGAQPVPYQGLPGGVAWVEGEFAAAYQEAVEFDSAAAQLLASRAASDQAVYLEAEAAAALQWLDRAEAAARRALELEPSGPQAAVATMALARAKGEGGLHRGALANARLPGELRELFERTLELEPGNADALVAYAAWHYALTEIGAGWLFGAD